MRNGVMNMQNVERFRLKHFEHFGGESQSVRRVIEKRVGDDLDFVKKDVRAGGIHPNGRGEADEMHVVAARSELLAQLRRDHSGAAICGITRDADAHATHAALSALQYLTSYSLLAGA